jgi:iron complex transport system substrate-binding protein
MIMRSPTRLLPALMAAATLAAACAACSSSPGTPASSASNTPATASFPVTVSTAGGTVTIHARPHAIISLSPTATEMLYAIGAGSQVKAVDDQSDYPAQAPKTTLSGFTPNAEAIAAYRPDLVIISNDMNKITAKLTALSIPVLTLPAAANLSQEYSEFDQLGEATGHLPQAQQETARIRSDLAKIVAAEPPHAKPLTYYYEISTNPYYSATSATFIGDLLSMLGMKSIADAAPTAAKSGGYPSLSAEFILKANPAFIILADTGPTGGGQDATTVARRPGWQVLTAVQDRRIILLSPDIASRWGPRVVNLLQDVAAGLTAGTH